MNNLLIKLLAQVDDGIVIFNLTGKVIFSNLEKTRFEGIVVDKQIADDSIMKEAVNMHMSKTDKVRDITLSMVEKMVNDNDTVIFQNEKLFCLYIKDKSDRAGYKTLRDNMFELINHELSTPMNHFTSRAFLVSTMLEESKGEIKEPEEFDNLIKITTDSAAEVIRKMERLLELSTMYGDEPMRSKERIQLIELAESVIYSLKPISSVKNIIVKLEQKGDVIGNLYGSFGWLKRAIEECLRNTIEHSNNKGEIHLQLQQRGHFVHIVIRDFGRSIAPRLKHTLFDPLNSGGIKDGCSIQGLGIGLSLAKKIIESHGGNIKNIGGAEFHIELPTGGLQISGNDLAIRQAQLYARDLAFVLKKKQIIESK